MSVIAVARRDFLDVRRAKLVYGPVALYTLFMFIFFWGQSQSENPDFYNVLWGLLGVGGILVIPLIALVAAYLSIAGERESGTIKYTLGVPVERSAVVLGKLLSRSIVVLAGIVVSFVIGTVFALILVPDMSIQYDDYVAFIGVTLLYALSYVSVAVAISASTASRSRAMAGGIGFFFLFNIGWNFLPISPTEMLEFLLRELGEDPQNYQNFLELVFSITPTGAYLNSMELYMPARIVERATETSAVGDPFYTQSWFMLVILLAWVVVPLALGYWRFQTAQLG